MKGVPPINTLVENKQISKSGGLVQRTNSLGPPVLSAKKMVPGGGNDETIDLNFDHNSSFNPAEIGKRKGSVQHGVLRASA